MTEGDLRLRLPSGLKGVAGFGWVVPSTTASSFPGRIDSMDPVFPFSNGDVDSEALEISSCMLVTFSSTFLISWSHCGMVSCKKVNALVMSDMVGEVVVFSVEWSEMEFLVQLEGQHV